MLILCIFIVNKSINVNAESANFYEAEYIDGIYMNKYQYSTQTTYYQKARFFRKSNTNEFAYCLEPFRFFSDNNIYESTLSPNNLTVDQIERISKIAYFGYGYKNHTDAKWYAVTQMMIWIEADHSGDYYFTDSLNGNRINPYQNEINEINDLIECYDRVPEFANKEFTLVEYDKLMLEDNENHLYNYHTDDPLLTIDGNHIDSEQLEEGEYNFSVYKYEDVYNKPLIFYQSNNSQNLIETGNLNKKYFNFKVKVIKTGIEINKIDKDTQSITPSGEGVLDGAKYAIMDRNMYKFTEIEIENNCAYINNLPFGKYYIQEIEPGEGYTLDENIYEITIDTEKPIQSLILENKIIEKEIIINKKYGDDENNLEPEENVSFNIFDKNNQLIDTITTDENGTAKIKLPYGEYKIIQNNTTAGYKKVDPILINIKDSEEISYELTDLKIPVPNTHTENNNNILEFILVLLSIIL